MPTGISVYSIPAAWHAVASSGLIWREASDTSVSPVQKSLKPSPVPGPSTRIVASGFLSA